MTTGFFVVGPVTGLKVDTGTGLLVVDSVCLVPGFFLIMLAAAGLAAGLATAGLVCGLAAGFLAATAAAIWVFCQSGGYLLVSLVRLFLVSCPSLNFTLM